MAIRCWDNALPSERGVALAALAAVRGGTSLPEALQLAGIAELAPRERALARRICQQALRHRRRLESQMRCYLRQDRIPPRLLDLLWLGAAQFELPDIPDHAAVHATVELAPRRWRGVVNAVLRRRLRESPEPPQKPALAHSFPDWLAAAVDADWDGQGEALMRALNREPPLCLRVNARRQDVAQYTQRLQAAGLAHRCLPGGAIVLDESVPLAELPGFAAGDISIQGAAAQLAAPLLPLEPGQRALDACAAPGGKTAHWLEREPAARVTALDVDAGRLARVAQTLERMGLAAELQAADATADGAWRQSYDAILIDAPCSGTGVIGRHPDIKSLRRESDIPVLAARQGALLDALWPLLAPGGRLLYCSCSVLSAENDAVISAFLTRQAGGRLDPFDLPVGQASAYGWRVPPDGTYEGFYFARLVKGTPDSNPR